MEYGGIMEVYSVTEVGAACCKERFMILRRD